MIVMTEKKNLLILIMNKKTIVINNYLLQKLNKKAMSIYYTLNPKKK